MKHDTVTPRCRPMNMEKLGRESAFKELAEHRPGGFRPGLCGWLHPGAEHPPQQPDLSFAAKVAYAKLLSYAWNNNLVFPGQERMAEEVGSSRSVDQPRRPGAAEAGLAGDPPPGPGQDESLRLKHRVKPSAVGEADSHMRESGFPSAGLLVSRIADSGRFDSD